MTKTKKCMEITVEGVWLECIMMFGKKNPYRLYLRTYSPATGYHRKQVAAYANFVSVIEYIRAFAHNTHWGFQDTF